MTTYGTIPTITTSSDDMGMMRSSGCLLLGTRRPWKEMLSFSLPESSGDALLRIKTNSSYFHMNYVIIILFVIFLSLLWHPVSLVVFLITVAAWLFLYFLRDNPLVVFGYIVDERVVLTFLSIFTMVLLLLISTMNVVSGLAVGVAIVVAHGALRRTDDLRIFIDEEEQGGGGQWPTNVHLRETAASSFSS
ncbi:PREDICTED: PRA1 family protein F3-like [Nicotiana attenuata]|uniref:PRA1 family protein n=1 Tax=Nicotiana attenuata TaxID=49451 RepID=A0A1J6IBJ9_NICAT|nr:PREDICTED: PRA1 family protein F3-like [Nicotiana attenuata]OIT02302.1 pra1 family protein f2 [Nicotiana attenuata]